MADEPSSLLAWNIYSEIPSDRTGLPVEHDRKDDDGEQDERDRTDEAPTRATLEQAYVLGFGQLGQSGFRGNWDRPKPWASRPGFRPSYSGSRAAITSATV